MKSLTIVPRKFMCSEHDLRIFKLYNYNIVGRRKVSSNRMNYEISFTPKLLNPLISDNLTYTAKWRDAKYLYNLLRHMLERQRCIKFTIWTWFIVESDPITCEECGLKFEDVIIKSVKSKPKEVILNIESNIAKETYG